ncbi:hypothetical protein H8356DRAFT_1617503 [Neocallimastix lanati (nom. inval.)]|nr:hypothetical protein H8356DRAFT_1617503 [Neocallimastix sp. JGI-2020a]
MNFSLYLTFILKFYYFLENNKLYITMKNIIKSFFLSIFHIYFIYDPFYIFLSSTCLFYFIYFFIKQ